MTTHSNIFAMGNPIDRGGWWALVHGVAKSHTTEHAHMYSTTNVNIDTSISIPLGFFFFKSSLTDGEKKVSVTQ